MMVRGLTVTYNPVDWLLIDHPSSSATCVQCGNSALFDNEFAQPQIFFNILYFRSFALQPAGLWDFKSV